MAKVVEAVLKLVEVVQKVLGGYAEGSRGCAEGVWRLCRRCLKALPKVLGGCAEGAWRLCRR